MLAVPPYYTDPKLNYSMIQELQILFATQLTWLDRSYHLARVGIDSEGLGYPQIHANNSTKESYNIRPDANIGAYSFFEEDAPFSIDLENKLVTYNLSVIFWANLDIIDIAKTYDFTSELIADVTSILNKYDPVNVVIDGRPEQIFEKYSGVTQELKQHLMRRYSAFKISFSVISDYSICPQNIPQDALNSYDFCDQNVVDRLTDTQVECLRDSICEITPCEPVSIIDQADTEIDSIAAGGTYQVLVFSGIDGGSPSSVFTNSIVGGTP